MMQMNHYWNKTINIGKYQCKKISKFLNSVYSSVKTRLFRNIWVMNETFNVNKNDIDQKMSSNQSVVNYF